MNITTIIRGTAPTCEAGSRNRVPCDPGSAAHRRAWRRRCWNRAGEARELQGPGEARELQGHAKQNVVARIRRLRKCTPARGAGCGQSPRTRATQNTSRSSGAASRRRPPSRRRATIHEGRCGGEERGAASSIAGQLDGSQ